MKRLFNEELEGMWGDKETELQLQIQPALKKFLIDNSDINPCDLGQLITTITNSLVAFETYND